MFVLDSIHTLKNSAPCVWTMLFKIDCWSNSGSSVDENKYQGTAKKWSKNKSVLRWLEIPLISLDGTEISIWQLNYEV